MHSTVLVIRRWWVQGHKVKIKMNRRTMKCLHCDFIWSEQHVSAVAHLCWADPKKLQAKQNCSLQIKSQWSHFSVEGFMMASFRTAITHERRTLTVTWSVYNNTVTEQHAVTSVNVTSEAPSVIARPEYWISSPTHTTWKGLNKPMASLCFVFVANLVCGSISQLSHKAFT